MTTHSYPERPEMTTTDDPTLLDLVDSLTLPQTHREEQDVVENGHVVGTKKVPVTHTSLLTQLNEAIAGAVGAGSSKGSLAFERNILDTDALYRFIKIDETIRQWCQIVGVRWGKDPAANLRAWYAGSRAKNYDEHQERFYLNQLAKWEREIAARLDPPRERELPNEDCPLCGASTFWRDGVEYRHPLVVRYKPLGADLIQSARAVCRACAAVWRVRELAYVLEHRAAGTVEEEAAG